MWRVFKSPWKKPALERGEIIPKRAGKLRRQWHGSVDLKNVLAGRGQLADRLKLAGNEKARPIQKLASALHSR